MPADQIKYQVLDVGQGSGNFIEMYTAGVLTNTVLIDLGSEHASNTGGGLSVEYIVDTLYTMANPTIEFLFLSHSDTDHISLLDQLLDSFDDQAGKTPGFKTLTINYVRYGGDSVDYGKKIKGKKNVVYNVLDRLKDYMPVPTELRPLPVFYTNYEPRRQRKPNPPLPPAPLAVVEDVEFWILRANAPTVTGSRKRPRVPTGYDKNTVSAIVVAEYRGGKYIATGDATGSTLAAANDVLTAKVLKDYFQGVMMVTAPHHCSESTSFSFVASNGKRNTTAAVANFKLFVDNLQSKSLQASAGKNKTFKHPSAYLMSYFWPWLKPQPYYTDPTLKTSNGHYYTAYFRPADGYKINNGRRALPWPDKSNWCTVQTAANVYTNNYYDLEVLPPATTKRTQVLPPNPGSINVVPTKKPFPPAGVAWTYEATRTANGSTVGMDRLDTNANLVALRREIIARSERMAAIRCGLTPEEAAAMPVSPLRSAPVPPHAVRGLPSPRPMSFESRPRHRRLKVLT